jgi:hypothetical protein
MPVPRPPLLADARRRVADEASIVDLVALYGWALELRAASASLRSAKHGRRSTAGSRWACRSRATPTVRAASIRSR